MDADVVWNMIDHLNYDSVTLSSNNSRPRELPINCHNGLCVAQSCNIFQLYLEKQKQK